MKKLIITISREYGSGGKEIGKRLAEKLNIPFYDKKIIEMSAEVSGLSKEFIEETEQKNTGNTSYGNVLTGTFPCVTTPTLIKESAPLADQLFNAQRKVILDIAEKGSCVIVGRCADYILKDHENVINVFIHADMETRMKRAIEEYGHSEKEVKSVVKKYDKKRSNHYTTYTCRKWGERQNYDLMLNSKTLGIDGCVNLLMATYNEYIK